jgi:hypothetical protein
MIGYSSADPYRKALRRLACVIGAGIAFSANSQVAFPEIYRCEDANGIVTFSPRQEKGCTVGRSSPAQGIYSYKDENGVTHFSGLPHLDKRYKLVYQVPDTSKPSTSKKEKLDSAQENRSPAVAETATSTSKGLESLQPTRGGADYLDSNEAARNVNATQQQGNVWNTPASYVMPDKETSYPSWPIVIGVLSVLAFVFPYLSRRRSASMGAGDLPNDEVLDGIRTPTFSSREKQVPAWYTTLGVSADAPIEEIQRAFRQRMSEYHPDKVASLGEELRTLAEEKSKEISLAYKFAQRLHGIER